MTDESKFLKNITQNFSSQNKIYKKKLQQLSTWSVMNCKNDLK